ncbi:MAG: hypothetical protein AB4911_12830 [Oscillochloridaceae bacterium umkhey_bin13]
MTQHERVWAWLASRGRHFANQSKATDLREEARRSGSVDPGAASSQF